jgi:glycosyltransferase involved in cell wall biosynthesis
MKICVYAIAKNEEKHVRRFIEAAKDADLIYISDTGSTDKTLSIIGEYIGDGIFANRISIKPWRFDDARNAALSLLPDDIDVCVSLDMDEILQPGWREEIERVWCKTTTRLRYGFDWGCGIVFQYEKIHARHGYRWHHPCHEYPVPDRITEVWANTDKLLVVHKPDNEKSRGQYLDLLKISVEEDPNCPRNAFYYARELSFNRMWNESIDQCKRYLALPRANWPNERCYAMRVIGRCYQELGDYESALTWLRKSVAEAPDTREPWCDLALACYRTKRWVECLGSALSCLEVKERQKVYTVDPMVWGSHPHDLASIAAWNLGLFALAEVHAKTAIELDPNDLRLRQNLELIRESKVAA